VPAQFDDDRILVDALSRRRVRAVVAVWDDPHVDWRSFDRVVIRSTWDYPRKLDAFLEWVDALGARVRNSPALVRWNSDKRYLADLAAAGLPVVATAFVAPGEAMPRLEGEVVVKPTVSAGARDTGRFGPSSHDLASRLIARLQGQGRVAMVQPYLPAVESSGEDALAFIAGGFSHALRKRAVLRPDEEAPVRDDPLGAAEAMYDPRLVEPAEARKPAREFAAATIRYLADRFTTAPLYARVDVVASPEERPVVLELEAIEPCLYLCLAAGAAERLADAVLADARR
jgi:hypothetical protein